MTSNKIKFSMQKYKKNRQIIRKLYSLFSLPQLQATPLSKFCRKVNEKKKKKIRRENRKKKCNIYLYHAQRRLYICISIGLYCIWVKKKKQKLYRIFILLLEKRFLYFFKKTHFKFFEIKLKEVEKTEWYLSNTDLFKKKLRK